MQFYENKNAPKLIVINKEINDKKLIEKTLEIKENKPVSIKIAKKGNELKVSTMAEKNAKEALTRKVYETESNRNLFEQLSNKFCLKSNISLIEVYDNSHIQGTNSVGALITYGDEGFIKKRYRKFNIKIQKNVQDDYGMMKEVFNRRFKRAIQEKDNFLS
jgi:excinuclease ABC subunit C